MPPEPTTGPDPKGRDTLARFPRTHWSILKPAAWKAGDADARRASLEALAKLYWKPIYAHLRLSWKQSREDAEDLTQSFLLRLLERPVIERVEPGYGRFRTYVRACLDNFMRNHIRDEGRLRRGGGQKILSLDFTEDPDALLEGKTDVTPEQVLDYQWKLTVIEHALARFRGALEQEGRTVLFDILKRYDLAESVQGRPTYGELGKELGLSASEVNNFLRQARRRLLEHVREIVAETVETPEDLKEELSFFFPAGAE